MNISWDAAGYEKGFLLVPAYGRGVIDLIDARPGATCLDLGCGNGALAVELRRRGLDAFGTDASAEMIEPARPPPRPALREGRRHELYTGRAY